VARALLDSVEELARASGVAELTAVASLRAAPVFARLGFREVARRRQPFDGHVFEVADVAKRL
jgi:hypothetical protein